MNWQRLFSVILGATFFVIAFIALTVNWIPDVHKFFLVCGSVFFGCCLATCWRRA